MQHNIKVKLCQIWKIRTKFCMIFITPWLQNSQDLIRKICNIWPTNETLPATVCERITNHSVFIDSNLVFSPLNLACSSHSAAIIKADLVCSFSMSVCIARNRTEKPSHLTNTSCASTDSRTRPANRQAMVNFYP